MGFKPALNLTEQIANHIADDIVYGRLLPQTRIQELRLAKELGVSRGSIREALLILESRHLITIIPRRGAIVTGLRKVDLPGFNALFSDLCVRCLQALARQQTSLVALSSALTRMEAGGRSGRLSDVLEGRAAYFEAILNTLNDYYLTAVLGNLVPASQRMQCMAAEHSGFDLHDVLRHFKAVTQAVRDRDMGRIDELVRAHARRQEQLALGGALNGGHAAGLSAAAVAAG